jgi:hypothetical protein
MNWYLKTIFAQTATTNPSTGLANYLERNGISSDIINYIISQPNQKAQLLVKQLNKNKNLTLEQLQNAQPKQVADVQIYLPLELQIASRMHANYGGTYPHLRTWILTSFKKLREAAIWEANYGKKGKNGRIIPENFGDRYNSFKQFVREPQELIDWMTAERIRIENFTPEQAMLSSDEWHKEQAEHGEGMVYDQINPSLIIYGPQWQNKDWEGWTIQRVVSENDLTVEGNRMGHCVGSYCGRVQEGRSIIYSLRDPANKPHVTLETGKDGSVQQIQGKGNEEPIDDYKVMIKEWVLSNKNNGLINGSEDVIEKMSESHSYDNEEEIRVIESIGKINEYGFKNDTATSFADWAEGVIDGAENSRRRDNEYRNSGITDYPYTFVDKMVEMYKNSKNDPNRKGQLQQKIWLKQIASFEEFLWRIGDEIWEYAVSNWDSGEHPSEDDYETPEEYEKAIEQQQEADDEYMSEEIRKTLKGGFSYDGLKRLEYWRNEKEIPSIEELTTLGYYKKS